MTQILRAGVIGLGEIGGGVALCLARAGRPLAVYDIRPDAAARLEGVPAVLPSPADVARVSDVVMIAVVSADQARAVLQGETGLLAAAKPGLTVVLLSTVSLTDLDDLTKICETAKVELVDCGVTNGQQAAHHGLVSLIGGPDETIDRIRPVLDDFSKLVVHTGGHGAGMAAKIARNVITYCTWRVGFEASQLCKKAGVNIDQMAAAVEASTDSNLAALFWHRTGILDAVGDEAAQQGVRRRVDMLMRKDIEAAQDLAKRFGLSLPVADITHDTGVDVFQIRN